MSDRRPSDPLVTAPPTDQGEPTASGRLAAIRQRADVATRGPWKVATHSSDGDYDYISGYVTSEHHTYCGCGVPDCEHRGRVTDWHSLTAPDAYFIATSRSDVPWLCDEVEQLARDVLSLAAVAGMPDTYWLTDQRIERAASALGLTPTQARAMAQEENG